METDIKCVNCYNFNSKQLTCRLDNSDTLVKKLSDIKDCFVLSHHLRSLDKMSELLNKMSILIDKNEK